MRPNVEQQPRSISNLCLTMGLSVAITLWETTSAKDFLGREDVL